MNHIVLYMLETNFHPENLDLQIYDKAQFWHFFKLKGIC